MGIRVTCFACGAIFNVRQEFAGKRGKCPHCGDVLRVPDHAQPPPVPTANSVAAAPPPIVPGTPAEASQPPVVAVGADDFVPTISTTRAPRRRALVARLPVWAWLVAGAATCAAGVLLTIVALGQRGAEQAAAEQAAIARTQPAELKLNRAPFNPQPVEPVAAPVAESDKPPTGAPLEDIIAYVKHGIVKIETSDGWNHRRGLGSGFIIDPRGLVATNYHVLSDAAKADVLFEDGTRYGVEGYTAIDPATDLAIIQLNGVPPGVKALELKYDDGPRDASQVYAIGHPYDHEFTTTGGIVGNVMRTAQLPDDTREWLTASLRNSDNDLWIQHDAKISPGNSGGPLLNARGEVIGVNSWVNQKVGLGYAIHARHLHDLIPRQFAVIPLRERRRTLDEPGGQAPAETLGDMQVASGRIRQLRAQLTAQGWRPQNDDDYATFDELARTITAVKYIQEHPGVQVPMPAEEHEAVLAEANEVVALLRGIHWQARDQILPINAHAGREREPYGGAFVFARVQRILHNRATDFGLLVELVGSAEKFFLPLEEPVPGLAEGDTVLILGITHPKTLAFQDNLRSDKVHILLSKVVLKVGK